MRRKLETLFEKNEAKDSTRDGLGIADNSEVVCFVIEESGFFT